MMKKTLLATLVIASFGAGVSNATPPPNGAPRSDIYGDRMINTPMNQSTVNTASVDVSFVMVPKAQYYTYDLVGSGLAIQSLACDNVSPNPNRVFEKRGVINASTIDCGSETHATLPGDSTGPAGNNLHLCKWTTPELPNGNYALAINPLVIGSTSPNISFQEMRSSVNCNPGFDDTPAKTVEDLETTVATATTQAVRDTHYQLFNVTAAVAAPSVAPTKPKLLFPQAGARIGSIPSFNFLSFQDDSGFTGQASYYQVWINKFDGTRETNIGATENPGYPGLNWFKNLVDTDLSCTLNNATGNRVCVVNLGANPNPITAFGHSINQPYSWWIRSWNVNGYSPWSEVGTFAGN